MKWERYGSVWRARQDASTFRIARSGGKYFLTEALSMFSPEVALGMYSSLAEAKEAAMKVHPSRQKNPSRRSVHTSKWDRCVKDVKSKGGAVSPYAVCTSMFGERGSVKKGHRRKNPLGKYVVRGVPVSGGKPVYYTGRAGQGWISGDVHEAFSYSNWEETLRKARLFNGREQLTGLHFEAQVVPKSLRKENPLPRRYYTVDATRGAHRYWLTKAGKLAGRRTEAKSYYSIEQAREAARKIMRGFPMLREYKFAIRPTSV